MDAHTLYPVRYLAIGIDRLATDRVAHVSGPQLARGDAGWSRTIALALQTVAGTGGARFRRDVSDPYEVDSGFTGVWEKRTLLRHGGWSEEWSINQDAELAARLRQEGGRLLCVPEMAAAYVPRNSLSGLAKQYFRYGMYRTKTTLRHRGSGRKSHFLPPALCLAAAVALSPGALGRVTRRGLLTYALLLLVEGIRPGLRVARPELVRVPIALCVMHFAWGLGSLVGVVRFSGERSPVAHC